MSVFDESQVMQQMITDDDCFDIHKIMSGLSNNPLQSDLTITLKGPGNSMTRIGNGVISLLHFTSDKTWFAWTTDDKIVKSILNKYNSKFEQWLSTVGRHQRMIDEASCNRFTLDICYIIALLLVGDAPHHTKFTADEISSKFPTIGCNDRSPIKLGCVACIFNPVNQFWLLEKVSITDLTSHVNSADHQKMIKLLTGNVNKEQQDKENK